MPKFNIDIFWINTKRLWNFNLLRIEILRFYFQNHLNFLRNCFQISKILAFLQKNMHQLYNNDTPINGLSFLRTWYIIQ